MKRFLMLLSLISSAFAEDLCKQPSIADMAKAAGVTLPKSRHERELKLKTLP